MEVFVVAAIFCLEVAAKSSRSVTKPLGSMLLGKEGDKPLKISLVARLAAGAVENACDHYRDPGGAMRALGRK